jgi:hypothetical protein
MSTYTLASQVHVPLGMWMFLHVFLCSPVEVEALQCSYPELEEAFHSVKEEMLSHTSFPLRIHVNKCRVKSFCSYARLIVCHRFHINGCTINIPHSVVVELLPCLSCPDAGVVILPSRSLKTHNKLSALLT